jgi:hypothetical protein
MYAAVSYMASVWIPVVVSISLAKFANSFDAFAE